MFWWQGDIQQPFFLSFIFFPDTNSKSIAIKRKKGQGKAPTPDLQIKWKI
jgi:hypothetical protein